MLQLKKHFHIWRKQNQNSFSICYIFNRASLSPWKLTVSEFFKEMWSWEWCPEWPYNYIPVSYLLSRFTLGFWILLHPILCIPAPSSKESLSKKDRNFYFHPIQHVVWDAYWRTGFFPLVIFKILLMPSGNRFPLTMSVYPHISLVLVSFLSVFQYVLIVVGETFVLLYTSNSVGSFAGSMRWECRWGWISPS